MTDMRNVQQAAILWVTRCEQWHAALNSDMPARQGACCTWGAFWGEKRGQWLPPFHMGSGNYQTGCRSCMAEQHSTANSVKTESGEFVRFQAFLCFPLPSASLFHLLRSSSFSFSCSSFFFTLSSPPPVLGVELGPLCMLRKHSATELQPQSHDIF